MLTKLKDGEGQYLWRMSVREGEPDTILGQPADDQRVRAQHLHHGPLRRDVRRLLELLDRRLLDMQIQRLVELYAETNQDGFIGRYEGDGMPVLEEAFARVKLA
jgi:HK97 family phage major capsid protein